MPFDFEPLLQRIDNAQQGIKLELFHQTATIIGDLCRELGASEIARALAQSIEALTQSAESKGRLTTYRGLHAFLHSPNFATMARGNDPAASRLHFRQLVSVLEGVLQQAPERIIDETRTYRIHCLLKEADIHSS